MPRHVPLATYRVQLHAGFGFDDVAAIAPYLAQLGVSHVYCSPYLQAAPGSTHGYDVVDHSRLNVELGGDEAYERMVEVLAANGLSHIVDIVPNHMSVAAGRRNRWWWDVLENGPSSRWAEFFDVDWSQGGRVLLPVLGDHYGKVLDAGEITLRREGGSFVATYFDHEVPISPQSVDVLVSLASEVCGADELATIGLALSRLPAATLTDWDSVEERHRDKEVLRGALARILAEQPECAAAVDAQVAAHNADAGWLDSLLARQSYRLAFWRTGAQELDYRRFFDVPDLVGLRMEEPRVFDETHDLILRLVRSGKVHGLRVDHPDGLRDPAVYLDRLRAAAGDEAWVVVEKILGRGESLPPAWACDGTTGYDFCTLVTGLFVDAAGESELTQLYQRFTGDEAGFDEVAYQGKRLVMRQSLTSDLDRLTRLALVVCDRHRRYRDYTRRELRAALAELAADFPVYRTYPGSGSGAIASAVAAASTRNADLDPDLLAFLGQVLGGEVKGDAEGELAARFQQFSAPVMAKGVEDTAFYRYLRLVALNEVGGDPGVFGTSPAELHAHNARMASDWPATMLTTSTHDTKRSEDVRARLAALSELPVPWSFAVGQWSARNAGVRPDLVDAGAEYLLYQTLVGAWPISADRLNAYLVKALREAKLRTSWVNPSANYEDAVARFASSVLADARFVAELETFLATISGAARVTSLAQTLLKLTCPGVPDIYQGTELWDLSLVDPDNRRPVDYERRRQLLEAGVRDGEDGSSKLWLIRRALAARRRRVQAFASGYEPLVATGDRARHAFAFLRGGEVAVIVPRLAVGLGGRWDGTAVELPEGTWADELAPESGRSWTGGPGEPVRLADVLDDFPVALLGRISG